MNYVGRWKFHSIGTLNDENELVYLNAEEYLNSPMTYVDESDEEAVADERRERRQMVGMQIEVGADGALYMLMPLPDGVTQAEIDEAVSAGEIKLCDGMIIDDLKTWEERNGELWIEVGTDMSDDGWAKVADDDSFINFITVRYVKAE